MFLLKSASLLWLQQSVKHIKFFLLKRNVFCPFIYFPFLLSCSEIHPRCRRQQWSPIVWSRLSRTECLCFSSLLSSSLLRNAEHSHANMLILLLVFPPPAGNALWGSAQENKNNCRAQGSSRNAEAHSERLNNACGVRMSAHLYLREWILIFRLKTSCPVLFSRILFCEDAKQRTCIGCFGR